MDIRGLLIVFGLFFSACKQSALPLPRMGPNENQNLISIPYPPPAPRPEMIPTRPGNSVVWIDGSWNWDRRRWVWQKGRWEVPPTGAHYAHAKIVHNPDGSLQWAAGGWQTRSNQENTPKVVPPE